MRLVQPGLDEYVSEKYAFEIMQILGHWSEALKSVPPRVSEAANFIAPTIDGCSIEPVQESTLRSDSLLEVVRHSFSSERVSGRDHFVRELTTYLSALDRVETAEFQIVAMEESSTSCLLYTYPSPRDPKTSRMPSSA